MPGVVVTTGVRSGPTGVNVAPASTWYVAGTSVRGPINKAVLVTSLSDFEAFYGDYNASFTLHQQVQTFFEEGGARCYVARAIGSSATVGTLTLSSAGPAAAMSVTAANPGAWSSDVSVQVTAGSVTGFVVKLYFQGSLVYSTGDVATVGAAVAALNSSTVASRYVTSTALVAGATLLPIAATALSSGAAGDSATVAQYVAALDLFGPEYGAGAVSIPGQFSTTAYNGLIAHALLNNRIAILGFNPALDSAGAISAASPYYTATGAEYAAFYFPHVTIPDATGASMTISPEGYVAAKRSLAHNQFGPWQAFAGTISQADFVTGISQTVNKTTGDTLDAGRVNAIRVIQENVRVYGARSVSSDELNFRYITYRDLLNYVVVEAERTLEDLVFSTIDGRGAVFGRCEARLIGLLEPLRASGGLYEAFDANNNQIDPGFSVQVDDVLNPVSQLATGLIRCKVGVRVSSVGDRIEVEVVKSNLTSSVV